MGLGDRLRSERKRVGLTQEQLAKLGDVTVQSQRMYEGDKRPPNAKYLSSIASQGIDVQYILTGHRSINQKNIYQEPTDALTSVLAIQDEFGLFDAEQIKMLLGFAWAYQVDEQGLREFVRTSYAVAGVPLNTEDKKNGGKSSD